MAYFEFGKSTLQIPEKMIFVNKQGYEKLAPTTTKSGSLTSRFGIRSLNVEPVQDNDINLIKGGVKEYIEIREQKKREKKTKEEKDKKYKDVKKKNKGVDKEILKYNEMMKNAKNEVLPKKKDEKTVYKRDVLLNDLEKLEDEYKNKTGSDKAKIKKKINEKKKQISEMDDEADNYYKRISDIKKKFSELLSNEYSENNYSIEQLKEKYKNVVNDVDNIINEMKKQKINSSMEMERLKKSKIIYMYTIDRLKNRRGKEEEKPVKKEEGDNYSKITALLIKAKELAKRMEGSEDKERFELMGRITKLFNDANKLDGGNKLKDRMKEVNTIKNIIKNLPPTPSEQLGI
jgi:hypothetical protein